MVAAGRNGGGHDGGVVLSLVIVERRRAVSHYKVKGYTPPGGFYY